MGWENRQITHTDIHAKDCSLNSVSSLPRALHTPAMMQNSEQLPLFQHDASESLFFLFLRQKLSRKKLSIRFYTAVQLKCPLTLGSSCSCISASMFFHVCQTCSIIWHFFFTYLSSLFHRYSVSLSSPPLLHPHHSSYSCSPLNSQSQIVSAL